MNSRDLLIYLTARPAVVIVTPPDLDEATMERMKHDLLSRFEEKMVLSFFSGPSSKPATTHTGSDPLYIHVDDVLPPLSSIEAEFASWGPPDIKPFIIEIPAKLPEPPFIAKQPHRERSHPKQPFYAKFHKNPKRNHRNKKH